MYQRMNDTSTTTPYANRNHATNLSASGKVISEFYQKVTLNLLKLKKPMGWMKWGTLCWIVRFVSHFSLKTGKIFHIMVSWSVGSDNY